jgi:hypothetical protein
MNRCLSVILLMLSILPVWGEPAADKVNSVVCSFIVLVELVIGALVSLVVIFAGLKYVLSGDDPGERSAARGIIINGFIGLLVVILSVPVINVLVNGIINGVNCEIIPSLASVMPPLATSSTSFGSGKLPTETPDPVKAVPAGPDLLVEGVTWTGSGELSISVRNIAGGSDELNYATGFDAVVYIPMERSLENLVLCNARYDDALSPSGYADLKCSVSDQQKMKDLLSDPGSHELVVHADPNGLLRETNKENNVYRSSITACSDNGKTIFPGECSDGRMCSSSAGGYQLIKNERCTKMHIMSVPDGSDCGLKCGGVYVAGYPLYGVKDCRIDESCTDEECTFDPGKCCTRSYCSGATCSGADQKCFIASDSCECVSCGASSCGGVSCSAEGQHCAVKEDSCECVTCTSSSCGGTPCDGANQECLFKDDKCVCETGVYLKVVSFKEIKDDFDVAGSIEGLLAKEPELDLIVIPEYSLYSTWEWPPWVVKLSCGGSGCETISEGSDAYVLDQIARVRAAARNNQVNIVLGTIVTEEKIGSDTIYYNTLLVIDRFGKMTRKYKVSGLDWAVSASRAEELDSSFPEYGKAREKAIASSGPIQISDRQNNNYELFVSVCDDVVDDGTFARYANANADIFVWVALNSDPYPPEVLLNLPRKYGIVKEDALLIFSNYFGSGSLRLGEGSPPTEEPGEEYYYSKTKMRE